MSTKIRGLVVILVAYAVACGGAPSGSDITCKDGMECSPGEICFFQTCRQLCNADGDCSGGLSCDDGVCVPGQSDGKGAGDGGDNPLGDTDGADSALDVAPLIFEVDGTGSVDGSPGHTAHHLRDRLLVIGQNLSGAALTLEGLDPVRAAVELDPCSTGTDTQVELGLPLDIVAGEYLLTASNQAGNCSSAPLFLLRGEQGQSGATGTVPSGLVGYFLGTCPPGWSTYAAAQGRVVVGVETAGTLEGTVGGALTDLAQPTSRVLQGLEGVPDQSCP